jgi:hypothetical protein
MLVRFQPNSASVPDIGFPGRISAGKFQIRPSGRPVAGRRVDFEAFPIRIWPKSGPETRSPARQFLLHWYTGHLGSMVSFIREPRTCFWPHDFLEARTIRFLKMCGFCLPWYPKPPKDHNLPTSERCEPWPATRLLPFGPWGGQEGRPDSKIDLQRY